MKKNLTKVMVLLAVACLMMSSAAMAADGASVPNPVREMPEADMSAEVGFTFTVPEGAEERIYALIDGTDGVPPVAQMTFKLGENTFTARMQTAETATDISGMFDTWTEIKEIALTDTQKAMLNLIPGEAGMLTWYDTDQKIIYCVSIDKGASEELLTSTAKALMPLPKEEGNG